MGKQQTEETHKQINAKQLVVLVRFKPGGYDTAGATAIVEEVSDPLESVTGAIEDAIGSIPGLNMFVKEEKKDFPSEKEYNYFKDYSNWDMVLDKIKSGLKEMNNENDILKFQFSSTDENGRKGDAKKLNTEIKSKMSSWKKYSAFIHFIGLGQGGNVVNECTDLLTKDKAFEQEEKWVVKSVVYVATPLYKNTHILNNDSMKGKGKVYSFGSSYDLTQGGIDYFDDNEQLLTLITDSNTSVLSLAVGKIKLRAIKILAIILDDFTLGSGKDGTKDLGKFDQIKSEIEGVVDDIVGFIEKLIDEGTSFVNLDEIPDFKNISSGYDSIPSKCVDELTSFKNGLLKKLKEGAQNTNLSVGPADLAGLLNCLCPVLDAISGSLSVLKPKTTGGEDLAKQIIDSAGIKKVFSFLDEKPTYLPVDEEYINKTVEAAKENKPDMATGLISKVQKLIGKATEETNEVNKMNIAQKQSLAEAISCLTLPMLTSKKEFYAKLLDWINLDLLDIAKDYTAENAIGVVKEPLASVGIQYPEKLKESINKLDEEVKRVKAYFSKSNFNLVDKADSLYLIYNSHNLFLKKCYGPIHQSIDKQTGYLSYMKAKGYDNECSLEENKYNMAGKKENKNTMPTTEVEDE